MLISLHLQGLVQPRPPAESDDFHSERPEVSCEDFVSMNRAFSGMDGAWSSRTQSPRYMEEKSTLVVFQGVARFMNVKVLNHVATTRHRTFPPLLHRKTSWNSILSSLSPMTSRAAVFRECLRESKPSRIMSDWDHYYGQSPSQTSYPIGTTFWATTHLRVVQDLLFVHA
jgi:hypothetical protein